MAVPVAGRATVACFVADCHTEHYLRTGASTVAMAPQLAILIGTGNFKQLEAVKCALQALAGLGG